MAFLADRTAAGGFAAVATLMTFLVLMFDRHFLPWVASRVASSATAQSSASIDGFTSTSAVTEVATVFEIPSAVVPRPGHSPPMPTFRISQSPGITVRLVSDPLAFALVETEKARKTG